MYLWNNSIPTINETVNVLLVGGVLILGSWVFAHQGQAILANLLTYIALTYRLTTPFANLYDRCVHDGDLLWISSQI